MSFDCDEVTLGWRFVLDDKGNVEDVIIDLPGVQTRSRKKLTIPLLGPSAGLFGNATSQSLDTSHAFWYRDGKRCYNPHPVVRYSP
jgi:hypothetical protein